MCYPLHHKTIVVPGGFEPPQSESKSEVLPLDERTIYVGAIGLEPMDSNEGGFTVKCSCRCAMLPSWKVGRGVFRYFIDERYSRLLLPSLGALSGVCVLPALPSSVSWIGELPHSSTPCYHGHTLWFPLFICTTERTRTSNTWFWRPVLYQLSYRRVFRGRCRNWTYVDSFADYRLNHSTNRPCSDPAGTRTRDSFIKSEVL